MAISATTDMTDDELWQQVSHHSADHDGVKIHYAAIGAGPLVVMVHGFPDFWYSWRKQMAALCDKFRVVALDLRGYNESDKPHGVDAYRMPLLVGDVAAVIRAEGQSKAIIVGHDWGGAVSWNVAMQRPDLVQLLVILNLPHPAGIAREILSNPQQRANSEYAFNFQKVDAHLALTAEALHMWVTDEAARPRYLEAFRRSDFDAMLNYYRANYPTSDGTSTGLVPEVPPKVQVPVLMFHGLQDQTLLPGALNDTWQWVAQDLTLMTIPDANHFVQQDAAALVSNTLRDWLLRRV